MTTPSSPGQGEFPPNWDFSPQRHLLERLVSESEIPKVLYHYTSGEGLAGILRTRRLWATDVRYLNDSAEFNYALPLVAEEVRRKRELTKVHNALFEEWERAFDMASNVRVYVTAFSSKPDSLSQWRAYARPFGFAIGLDVTHVLAVATDPVDAVLFYRCVYEPRKQLEIIRYGINYLIEEYDRRKREPVPPPDLVAQFGAHFLVLLLSMAASLKHPAFEEESEWRLVARLLASRAQVLVRRARIGPRMFIPYVELPIGTKANPLQVAKVIIGPTPNYPLARQGLDGLLHETQTVVRNIDDSKVPFRDW